MAGITSAGRNFLKCAYAAPDFAVDPGQGIPDGYEGKALMRKDVYTNTISFEAAKDTFILVMPTPGISYWSTTVASGTFPNQMTVWTPTYNTSFETLFGTKTDQSADAPINPVERDLNVSKFRYASSAFEITPTSNYYQYAGSITVWKFTASLDINVQTSGTGDGQNVKNQMCLIGMAGLSNVAPDNKPFKFIDGAYSMAVNSQPTWEFHAVRSGITRVPGVGEQATGNVPLNPTYGQFHGDIIGVGDLQCMVFRVSTPTGGVNSAIVKSWSCIEYQPTPSSAFYQFAGNSPVCDPVALKLYKEIAQKVPVAVPVMENEGFWSDRVVPIIKSVLATARVAGAFLPPVGQVVSGIDQITSAFGWL